MEILSSRLLRDFPHGFTTRRGGVSRECFASLNLGGAVGDEPSAVEANWQQLRRGTRLDFARVRQVHGDRVLVATEGRPPIGDADAVVSVRPGLAACVSVADCVPILVADPGSRAVAAVHAGWRGAARGVASAAVRALAARAACTPRDVTALIGPCIHPCCYPVGSEVAACFPPECLVGRDGATRLDLPRTLTLELQRAGVGACHDVKRCTSCQSEWFFSHRRDGDRTGRQWGLAFLPAAHHT